MYMRIRNVQGEFMVSICDENCLGKTYREGEFVLRVTPQFYGDQLVTIDKALFELKKAITSINLNQVQFRAAFFF